MRERLAALASPEIIRRLGFGCSCRVSPAPLADGPGAVALTVVGIAAEVSWVPAFAELVAKRLAVPALAVGELAVAVLAVGDLAVEQAAAEAVICALSV